MTLVEIRAKCRRLKQREGLKMVVIDYLQLLTSGKRVESRQQEVSAFSRALKLMAKELQVPVIALSQLNRGAEQRADKKPALSDLRESGSIDELGGEVERDAELFRDRPRLEGAVRREVREPLIGRVVAVGEAEGVGEVSGPHRGGCLVVEGVVRGYRIVAQQVDIGERITVGGRDTVQTRRNDRLRGVENRAQWIVHGIRDEYVSLVSVSDSCEVARLSTDYAREHLQLAYASTVHGVQGDTADASVVGPDVDAAGLYVGLTRGRLSNVAIVVARTDAAAGERLAESIQRGTPELTMQDSVRAAEAEVRRAALYWEAAMAAGPVVGASSAGRGIGM